MSVAVRARGAGARSAAGSWVPGPSRRWLTAAELELVDLVADGLTSRAIARRLEITEDAVKTALCALGAELGLSPRAGVVGYAYGTGQFALRPCAPPEWPLSRRRGQVLALLAAGLSNAQIAGRLEISVETVRSHVRLVLKSLRARSRAHAVRIGADAGLIAFPASPAGPAGAGGWLEPLYVRPPAYPMTLLPRSSPDV